MTATLRVPGLADSKHFTNLHRVLSPNGWSPWVHSKLPHDTVIIHLGLPAGTARILLTDSTLQRSHGSRIKYRDSFRYTICSESRHVAKSLGNRWPCLAVMVPVPWSRRL